MKERFLWKRRILRPFFVSFLTGMSVPRVPRQGRILVMEVFILLSFHTYIHYEYITYRKALSKCTFCIG